jgi:hypothetical protein
VASEQWALAGSSFHDPSNGLKIRGLSRSIARRRPAWLENPDADGAVLGQVPRAGLQEIVFRLQYSGLASMDTALGKMATLIDKVEACKLDPNGSALVWTPHGSAKSGTFRALLGEVVELPIELGGDGYGWFVGDPVFVVSLTCSPFWEGTESTPAISASWTTPSGVVTVPDVPGDAPALGELVVTNDEATDHVRWLMWGSGPDAGGLIDSDALVTTGFSGVGTTRTGAYDVGGGNTVIRATLTSVTTAVCGTGELMHEGTYKVLARVYATESGAHARLVWQDKDGPFTANPWDDLIAADNWVKLDLGTINVVGTSLGDQVWSGRIEAYNSNGGTLDVDFIVLVPVADGHGLARATTPEPGGVVNAYDDFTGTTSGSALGTRTPVIGSAWATAGAATDFAFIDAGAATGNTTEAISRSATSSTPRFAVVGSVLTNMEVSCKMGIETGALTTLGPGVQGPVARYVDTSNYLRLNVLAAVVGSVFNVRLELFTIVAGTVSTQLATSSNTFVIPCTSYVVPVVTAYASGAAVGRLYAADGTLLDGVSGFASELATGGALDDGKGGVVDSSNLGGDTYERWYDDVTVTAPPAEAVVAYAGQDFRVTHNEAVRADADSGRYGVPPYYRPAGHFYLQPEGAASRSTHMVIIGSPTDLDTGAWSTIDHSLTADVTYTPRGNAIPR